MKKSLLSISGIVVLAVILILVNSIASKVFSSFSLDLTADGLYTLSKGSKSIIGSLPESEQVTLRYFFSSTDSAMEPTIQFYGRNVLDLLKQYERQAKGKIKLEVYDPRPDTEEEEWAQRYGLEPFVSGQDFPIYLGLVASSKDAREEVIPAFDFARERFLEYDISRILTMLVQRKKPVVGVLTTVKLEAAPVVGQYMGLTPWVVSTQLSQMADIKFLTGKEETIDPTIQLLIIIHPKEMPTKLSYAIDQYVLRGGSMLVLVDPYAEHDIPVNAENAFDGMTAPRSSDMNNLLSKWGVALTKGNVVGDLTLATRVNLMRGGAPVPFVLWPSIKNVNVDQMDVTTSALNNLVFPWIGNLEINAPDNITVTPLIKSSENAILVPEGNYRFEGGNVESLLANYKGDRAQRVLAARVRGKLPTNFPNGKPKDAREESNALDDKMHLQEGQNEANIVVIADLDFLNDKYAINYFNFLGKQAASLKNDNINFFLNVVENLLGSSDLISIRSRGRFTRPFTVVQDMEEGARQQLKNKEEELNASLTEANQRLQELQGEGAENSKLLSKQIIQEINNVKMERQAIMRQIREVRRQFREGIEGLGNVLFVINTFVVPLLLIIVGVVIVDRRRRQK
ncbi:MAG: Gldg family protein [Deltaproteobacteria bacterium]|nr:Gldg family protein [Deltaproteobacteria bacterium]